MSKKIKKTSLKISSYLVYPATSIRDVLSTINNNKDGIALVVDKNKKLVGTITDGDIRRHLLSNKSFDEPCETIMWKNPATAPLGAEKEFIKNKLIEHRLRNLPLVDAGGKPCELINLQDLLPQENRNKLAVIMCGGEGKRLRPITNSIPKPLVHVGKKPILENIIQNLKKHAVTEIYLTVNHQSKLIEDYFGDGAKWGVAIRYIKENKKLGTAGGLSLLPIKPKEPFIVMNGDVLTTINFNHFLEFHRHHRGVMSIAASEYHIGIPYGVLDLKGHHVFDIQEKPTKSVYCNAGIYLLNPEILHLIPKKTFFNITDLMSEVIREGLPVSAFPIREYWIDIGQKEDLNKARRDFDKGEAR